VHFPGAQSQNGHQFQDGLPIDPKVRLLADRVGEIAPRVQMKEKAADRKRPQVQMNHSGPGRSLSDAGRLRLFSAAQYPLPKNGNEQLTCEHARLLSRKSEKDKSAIAAPC
jgi:hypothetical protein